MTVHLIEFIKKPTKQFPKYGMSYLEKDSQGQTLIYFLLKKKMVFGYFQENVFKVLSYEEGLRITNKKDPFEGAKITQIWVDFAVQIHQISTKNYIAQLWEYVNIADKFEEFPPEFEQNFLEFLDLYEENCEKHLQFFLILKRAIKMLDVNTEEGVQTAYLYTQLKNNLKECLLDLHEAARQYNELETFDGEEINQLFDLNLLD